MYNEVAVPLFIKHKIFIYLKYDTHEIINNIVFYNLYYKKY